MNEMKISIGANVASLTHSLSRQFVSGEKQGQGFVKRDSIMISDEARQRFGQLQQNKSTMIENLMKQREKIQEMKSNLTERTLENGDDLSLIKDRLKDFDKQLAEIDEHVFALETQKREKEQREKEEKRVSTQPAANSEAAQMTSLLQSTQSLEQVKALKSVKGPIERFHRRLTTEMRNDTARGTFIESKNEKITDLEKRMQKLDTAMSVQVKEAKEASDDAATQQVDEKV